MTCQRTSTSRIALTSSIQRDVIHAHGTGRVEPEVDDGAGGGRARHRVLQRCRCLAQPSRRAALFPQVVRPCARRRPSRRRGRGSPLTPPPRRAPAPASRTRGCSVSTPQAPDLVVAAPPTATTGRGGRCGRPAAPTSASRSTGLRTSRHGRAVGVAQQAVLDRLGQHAVHRGAAWPRARRSGRRPGRREQPRGHVQAERRERVVTARAQVGAEDRVVGERVAVGLDGRHVRDPPGGRLPRTPARAGWRSRCTWNVPANAAPGRRPSAAAAAGVSSMFTFSCAPSGAGPPAPCRAAGRARPVRTRRARAARPPGAASPSASVHVDLGGCARAAGVDRASRSADVTQLAHHRRGRRPRAHPRRRPCRPPARPSPRSRRRSRGRGSTGWPGRRARARGRTCR